MPTYDYECASCGPFEAVRSISDRNEPMPCRSCGEMAAWLPVAAPRLAVMSADQRLAFSTNERASHEPQHSSTYRHPTGCSCCRPASKNKQAEVGGRGENSTNKPMKTFNNKRPWMISH
ncbi:MAG: hypothetical protein RL369_845 [Pseudomonadota bacterium]|jgi:putative FmdB family regulatory protein